MQIYIKLLFNSVMIVVWNTSLKVIANIQLNESSFLTICQTIRAKNGSLRTQRLSFSGTWVAKTSNKWPISQIKKTQHRKLYFTEKKILWYAMFSCKYHTTKENHYLIKLSCSIESITIQDHLVYRGIKLIHLCKIFV